MKTPVTPSTRTLRRDLVALVVALRPAARIIGRAISRAYWFTLSAILSIGVGFLIAFLFMGAVVGVAEILTGIGDALR